MSYAQLDSAANRLANATLANGLEAGDFVVIMSGNIIEYPVVHFGIARTGCVLVHVSPLFGSVELSHILELAKPKLIVVDEQSQQRLADNIAGIDSIRHLVVIGEPQIERAVSMEDFWRGSDDTPPGVELAETDDFAMTFTGGTTGLPKGALVNHKARYVSAFTTAIEHGLQHDDVVAVVTPLYHVVSMLIWMQAAMLVGATCVLQRRWDVTVFERLALEHGITSVLMVPAQLTALLASEQISRDPYAKLKQIGCAGASLSAETKQACLAKLPHATLIDHYGQSETGVLTTLNVNRHLDRLDTVGQPAVGVELEILDPDGKPVSPGQIGAIVVRGDFVFSGYFNNEDENRLYFRDGSGRGWTGDLGTLDLDGYLTIVGRSKEMIVSGGINIYPRELERILEERADVKDCAVFGVPDDRWGEALVASVVTNDPALNAQEIIAYCESRLARYKRPKYVWFVDEIPKTPSGKTLKNRLLREFLGRQLTDSTG
ncbi:MAG: acyl--CoA ligase [Planctomycetes bacterium]|nr:acyl--CoA ligase [Planctomycetota bacterium]